MFVVRDWWSVMLAAAGIDPLMQLCSRVHPTLPWPFKKQDYRVASRCRRSRRMRLDWSRTMANGSPAYPRRWHCRQRTGYCSSSSRSISLKRKRERRKLEEEHSGQITAVHRLPIPKVTGVISGRSTFAALPLRNHFEVNPASAGPTLACGPRPFVG